MSSARHPLLLQMMRDLPFSDHWYYLLPAVHVFFSTGPMFVTRHYNSYVQNAENLQNLSTYILNGDCYAGNYLLHIKGGLWHEWDNILLNKVWKFVKKHNFTNIFLAIVFLAIFFAMLFFIGGTVKSGFFLGEKVNSFSHLTSFFFFWFSLQKLFFFFHFQTPSKKR
eukprot:TRINITY_DN6686_c0_g1_i1.p1 TRINITY_DN6686_c0_g1~~TRINITY_DN6686_c0_g1_i1.p1  ORF type:complete len:167 (-),score=13.76 TRINITY_DN6686_c0_g1_i1:136-636(-)